uniref:Recombinase domain-containing protein n=1 Tax=Desulfatirhabdium butyrativorans TaxID=340467 RepID=A0A7C4RR47_9BACT
MTRVLTNGRIDRLEKYLQEWIDAIKSLETVQRQRLTTEERLVSTMDRIAGQLEKIVALGVMDEPMPRIVQRIPSRVLDLSENPDASQTREPWSRERIVQHIQDLHRGGMKEEEILMTLMASKVPTLNGKGTWRIQSVQRICRQMQQT